MNERFAVFARLQLSQRERGSRAPRAETTPRPERRRLLHRRRPGAHRPSTATWPSWRQGPCHFRRLQRLSEGGRSRDRCDRWRAGERRDRRSAPRFRPQELDLSADDFQVRTLQSPPSRNTHRHCTRPRAVAPTPTAMPATPTITPAASPTGLVDVAAVSPLITLFDIGIMGMADALVRTVPNISPANPITSAAFDMAHLLPCIKV